MARLKKTSAVLETARKRLAGLKSIKTPPDFGPNLTIPGYEAKSNSVAARLEAYNQALAMLDQLLNEFQAEEAELNELNRRYLSAAEAIFWPRQQRIRDARRHPQERTQTPNPKRRPRRHNPAKTIIRSPRFPVRWRPTRNLHRGSSGFGLLMTSEAGF